MRLNLPWTSPVMGLRFEMEADDLAIFYPDGQRFEDPQNWIAERDKAWAKLRELGVIRNSFNRANPSMREPSMMWHSSQNSRYAQFSLVPAGRLCAQLMR